MASSGSMVGRATAAVLLASLIVLIVSSTACASGEGGTGERCAGAASAPLKEPALDALIAEHGDTIGRVLGEELNAHVRELGSHSNGDGYMERFFLTLAWFEAQALVMRWMRDAGLDVWMDTIGNVHGRTPSEINPETDEPVLMLGSHVDSVRDGGKYDGHLGVVTGIAAAKAVVEIAKATGSRLVRPIHVVSFGDEGTSCDPPLFARTWPAGTTCASS